VIRGSSLLAGSTKSCGCMPRKPREPKNKAKTSERRKMHDVWKSMKFRCNNPKSKDFHNYGGRGIKACDRWLDFDTFSSDVGLRAEGMTIDRVDVNGHYEPANFRWATRHEQRLNVRHRKEIKKAPKRRRGLSGEM